NAAGQDGVVIEQIPLAFKLTNGVVGCPAYYRSQNLALVSERPVGVVTGGIAQEVGVTSGVRQVVIALILVHPGAFEVTASVVASQQRLALLVQNHHLAGSFCKLFHICRQACNPRTQCRLISSRFLIIRTVDVVAIVLQLTAPEAAEIHVVFTIVITEYGRVDGIAAFDGLRLRGEWAGRVVAYRHTNLDYAVGSVDREVSVLFAFCGGRVRGPSLPISPWHILRVTRYTAVLSWTVRCAHPQYVIVLHAEVIPVVIETDARGNVVG